MCLISLHSHLRANAQKYGARGGHNKKFKYNNFWFTETFRSVFKRNRVYLSEIWDNSQKIQKKRF